MNFSNAFRNNTNVTSTENGARVYSSTGNSVLDLFGRIGGMRSASEYELINAYNTARRENKELADNMILYTRNIREGGIGERRIARILLKELVKLDPAKVSRNLDTIVSAGRWDDLFIFMGTPIEEDVINFIRKQFMADITAMKDKSKSISLLAKWMPSVNTSSAETRKLARKFVKAFGLSLDRKSVV